MKLDRSRVLEGVDACQDLLRGLGYSPAEGYAIGLYLAETFLITAPNKRAIEDLKAAKVQVNEMTWGAAMRWAAK